MAELCFGGGWRLKEVGLHFLEEMGESLPWEVFKSNVKLSPKQPGQNLVVILF